MAYEAKVVFSEPVTGATLFRLVKLTIERGGDAKLRYAQQHHRTEAEMVSVGQSSACSQGNVLVETLEGKFLDPDRSYSAVQIKCTTWRGRYVTCHSLEDSTIESYMDAVNRFADALKATTEEVARNGFPV